MKKVAIILMVPILLVLTIFPSAISPVEASPSLSGIQIYPPDHIWNVPIDTLPLDPKSDTYITSSNAACSGDCLLYLATSSPVNVVNSTQAKQKLTSITLLSGRSDDIPYPIPANPKLFDSDGERCLYIVDHDAGLSYEMYNPVRAPDGTWSADVAVMFDLSSYTLRPDNRPAVSASGLPVVPGILRYEEVVAGSIDHAMIVHMYTSGEAHVWPARADGVENNGAYPPLGQRFRLKASFDTSGYSPHAKTVLEAWKKYGVMLADQNLDTRAWTIAADTDTRWRKEYPSLWNEMATVHGSDFEAVNVSSLMINKDSGQARILPIVTPTPAPSPQPDVRIPGIALLVACIGIGVLYYVAGFLKR
jgi:hypothetical protein